MKRATLLKRPLTYFNVAAIGLVVMFSSCQKEENVVSPEKIPGGILQTIQNFNADFEYDEYDSAGNASNARGWGYYNVWAKPTFNTLLKALEYTGLDEVVQAQETTIFGPTDKAFRKLGLNKHNITEVPKEKLINILTYHVLAGKVFKKDVESGAITMINGQDVKALKYYYWIFLKGAENKYWSQVIYPDVEAFNGVFHVINRVLLPEQMVEKNLVETLTDKGFSTLVDLAVTAGLGDALANGGPFTVFAPNEKAFEKLFSTLSQEEVDALLANDAELLRKVLLHHVVEGEILSKDLTSGKVATLNGDKINIDAEKLTITSYSGNKVNLVLSGVDIKASNGVIHEIDMVLLPREVVEALRKDDDRS